MPHRILVLAYSELHRDPRVDRQIKWLREHYQVAAAGFSPPSDPEIEFHRISWEPQPFVHSVRRRALSGPRALARRFEKLHWADPMRAASRTALRGVTADLVLVNDVVGLPTAFEVANGAPVVLDSHEHAPTEFAERPTWRFIGGPYAVWLLRTYGPRLAAMTAVSPGIAEAYEAQFGWKVQVITNAPFKAHLSPTPVATPIRLIHHGLAAERRQLELLIEAVAPLTGRVTLELMLALGSPAYFRKLERLAARHEHVSVRAAVPYEDIIPTIHAFDVGVHLVPPGAIHDNYQLPNKIFEFIQARLALVVSPSRDIQTIVEGHGVGLVATAPTAEAFRAALEQLDTSSVQRFKEASDRAADVLNAETNREILLSLVERALRP